MVSRGAENLILLSRSGPKGEPTKVLLEECRVKGVQVHAPPCDIADSYSLANVLDCCSRGMPPIKGCIQAAMVLRVSIFPHDLCAAC